MFYQLSIIFDKKIKITNFVFLFCLSIFKMQMQLLIDAEPLHSIATRADGAGGHRSRTLEDDNDDDDDDDDDNDDDSGRMPADSVALDDASMRFVYFSIDDVVPPTPKRPTTTTTTSSSSSSSTPSIAGEAFAVIVDKSFSRRVVQSASLERSYLRALLDAVPTTARVDLFIVRERCCAPIAFGRDVADDSSSSSSSNSVDWRSALMAHIDAEPCDGATLLANDADVEAMLPERATNGATYCWRLLISDGLATLGASAPRLVCCCCCYLLYFCQCWHKSCRFLNILLTCLHNIAYNFAGWQCSYLHALRQRHS